MKQIITIIIALYLTGNLTKAQDFFTCGTSTVIDIDGNSYNTVSIGSQCWMAANLKTTKYRDNTAIPNVTSDTTWNILTTGAYCYYNNTPSNSTTYGKLYNWYAVTDAHNICPTGWHIPSDGEWNIMEKYFESGTSHWTSGNNGTNSSSFTALPGGYRNIVGSFFYISYYGYWWTATEYAASNAWGRSLRYSNATVFRYVYYKAYGFSVRCLKDN